MMLAAIIYGMIVLFCTIGIIYVSVDACRVKKGKKSYLFKNDDEEE